jgi:glycosyltransferase involved in cell wall biosynthesis
MSISLSVLIPVLNDKEGIEKTLNSVMNQTIAHSEYEVIVCDNGSTDGTQQVIQKHIINHPSITLLEETTKSSYAARNKAILKSKAPILAFIDSDMTCGTDWLAKINNIFKKVKPDYVGSRVIVKPQSKSLSAIYNTLTSFHTQVEMNKNHFSPTCCLSVKKSLFDEIGLFDHRLESGGDWEFGNRVYNQQFKTYYANEVVVYHPSRTTFKQLINKTQRVARGKAQLKFYHPIIAKDISKNYFKIKNYLPKTPWKTKKKYRAGFSFSIPTLLMFCLYPAFSLVISFISYLPESIKLRTKIINQNYPN